MPTETTKSLLTDAAREAFDRATKEYDLWWGAKSVRVSNKAQQAFQNEVRTLFLILKAER